MTSEIKLFIDRQLRSVELIDPEQQRPEEEIRREELEAKAAQALAVRQETLDQKLVAVDALTTQLREIGRTLQAEDAQLLSHLRQASIEIGVAIARQLIHKQIATDAFGIQDVVATALARLETVEPVTVRLNAADLELLQLQQSAEDAPRDGGAVHFVADATLARGDCECVTTETRMVVRLQDRIEEIREYLLSENACWD